MASQRVLECRGGHGASIAGILPQLGILAAYAAVLLTLAAWRLRHVLSA